MSRTPRSQKKATVALPPTIMAQAKALAELKELDFDKYVSELVWVAVATHNTSLRDLEKGLGGLMEDDGDE